MRRQHLLVGEWQARSWMKMLTHESTELVGEFSSGEGMRNPSTFCGFGDHLATACDHSTSPALSLQD